MAVMIDPSVRAHRNRRSVTIRLSDAEYMALAQIANAQQHFSIVQAIQHAIAQAIARFDPTTPFDA